MSGNLTQHLARSRIGYLKACAVIRLRTSDRQYRPAGEIAPNHSMKASSSFQRLAVNITLSEGMGNGVSNSPTKHEEKREKGGEG